MTLINISDAIFGSVPSQTNPALMTEVVRLINESPSLVDEINALDSTPDIYGGHAMINLRSNDGEGGDTFYHAPSINISGLPDYSASARYYSGSFNALYDSATPAAAFVGVLAHEIGHWLDAGIAPISTRGMLPAYSIEQAVATEFASEGKAAYSQYVSKVQIDAANGGAGTVLFHFSNSWQQDTPVLRAVSHIGDVGQAQSYLGSQFWNVDVNGGTYLSNNWIGYSNAGAVNFLGIDYTTVTAATVTAATVQLNDAGVLTGSTLQTTGLDYSFVYGSIGSETASISDAGGNQLYTEVFGDSGATIFALARYQTGGSFAQTANADETVIGNGNNVVDAGNLLALQGNQDTLIGTAAAGNDSLTDGANVYFDQTVPGSTLQLVLAGGSDVVVPGEASTNLSGTAVYGTVFGGQGALDYTGAGGTLVLSGGATVNGSGASTVLFGGSGQVFYNGGSGYDDVIMSVGSATIHASDGGGWYEGGTAGANFITGSDSGRGTILAAGGDGDTINGGTHGGDFFLAGAGNETLNGGNSFGIQTMFLGDGFAAVTTGAAGSIIDTGAGTASIDNFGQATVYGGTDQGDIYTAQAGQLDVVGFRVGIDHVAGGVAWTAYQSSNTDVQLSNGASITLVNLHTSSFA